MLRRTLRRAGCVARISHGHEALVTALEQFVDRRRARRLVVDGAELQPFDRRELTAELPVEQAADRGIIRVAGTGFNRQLVEEGHVGKDRNTDFAVDFLDVDLAPLTLLRVEAEDVTGVELRIDFQPATIGARFGTDCDTDGAGRQIDQIAGDVACNPSLIEAQRAPGVDRRKGDLIARQNAKRREAEVKVARAKDAQRNAAREQRSTGRGGRRLATVETLKNGRAVDVVLGLADRVGAAVAAGHVPVEPVRQRTRQGRADRRRRR